HMAHLTDPGRRDVAKDVAVEVHHAALVARLRQEIRDALDKQASEMTSCTPLRPRSTRWRRNADQLDLSSLAPSQIPRISRNPSELTAEATSSETLRTSPAQLRCMTMPSR